jgi:hypothetical protein
VLVFYLGGIFALYQLVLWPLAVRETGRPLRDVAGAAALIVVRRPVATIGLGIALLLINLVGLIAAAVPFLTITIAYSALAAARFALRPKADEEEVSPWPA